MRFWDASGIVAVCTDDGHASQAVPLLEQDPDVAVWWGTSVECMSGFRKQRREGQLDDERERQALARLEALARVWLEVAPSDGVRRSAERLLYRHALKAADALQLAAALEWAGEGGGGDFVSFDQRLARAAAAEGFTILPG